MKKTLLFLIALFISSVVHSQCTTTNATSCVCKDTSQTDCDLLPDIQIGFPPFYNYNATYGVIEFSQTGNGTDNGRLKITVSTPNVGAGPLEVRTTDIYVCGTDTFFGTTPALCPDSISYPKVLINQRVYHKNGAAMTYYDRPAGTMTYHPTHSHMHVDDWGIYTLRTDNGNPDPLTWPIIGSGSKLAFCLEDYGTCPGWPDHCRDSAGTILNNASDFPNYGLGGGTYNCDPDVQGITSGFVDVYWTSLDGMWINVPPGVCNGDYYIVTQVDPYNYFVESNENNNVYVAPYHLNRQVPNPSIDTAKIQIANSMLNLCQGESVTLTIPVDSATYLWSNGDTTQASVISTPGTYSVNVSNLCGSGLSNTVTVNVFTPPLAPAVADDTIPVPGTANLTAIGAGNIRWYDLPTGGTLLGTGSSFTTPFLNNTTIFYAEDNVNHPGQAYTLAPPDSALGGGGFLGSNNHLVFNVYNTIVIESVKVYADAAGSCTIRLRNSSSVTLDSVVFNYVAGTNIAPLNFTVNPGTGYQLRKSGGALYRTNLSATPSPVPYPYTIDNFVSITGSNQGSDYYYYFYDWHIHLPDNNCESPRVPATAIVLSPVGAVDILPLTSFNAYPNPAGKNVEVSFVLPDTKSVQLELINSIGEIVYSESLQNASSAFKTNIDLENLSKGVYSIHVLGEQKNYYHKLVIQ